MFRITGYQQSEGFQMVFANGWEISVQFGPHHYCTRNVPDIEDNPFIQRQSVDAEVAVFNPQGQFVRLNELWENDDVIACVSPDQVAAIIAEVSAK